MVVSNPSVWERSNPVSSLNAFVASANFLNAIIPTPTNAAAAAAASIYGFDNIGPNCLDNPAIPPLIPPTKDCVNPFCWLIPLLNIVPNPRWNPPASVSILFLIESAGIRLLNNPPITGISSNCPFRLSAPSEKESAIPWLTVATLFNIAIFCFSTFNEFCDAFNIVIASLFNLLFTPKLLFNIPFFWFSSLISASLISSSLCISPNILLVSWTCLSKARFLLSDLSFSSSNILFKDEVKSLSSFSSSAPI